jgi:uncharacterized protein (TIGR03437 family)
MSTGQVLDFPPQSNTAPVTVTIGSQNAAVVYSIAAPGFPGLYQIAVTMPSGVAPGNVPVVLRMGTVASASVNMAVQ